SRASRSNTASIWRASAVLRKPRVISSLISNERSSKLLHHARVDAARHGPPERLDRGRLGQEVGVLDQDPFAREADRQVVEDLHRGRGALGLHAGDVNNDVARRLERSENVLAHEELAGLVDPVFAEVACSAFTTGPASRSPRSAVLEHPDRIAFQQAVVRQAGQRIDEFGHRRIALDAQ
ncbi:hypothetical protein, partial [Methylibium sp.]|uniref:hypothetical protein n=1 Tax=Methylibium sp. TaxID=2067992 RepID=UPI0017C87838